MRTVLLLTMLGFVIVSCEENGEEPNKKTNFFTIDGTEYSLSGGLTEEYGGDATSGYNFDLTVYSSGIDASDYENNGFTGAGDLAYFELWSTSATGLVTGTYTFAANEAPNTFTIGQAGINFNLSAQTFDALYSATAGTVSITKDGSNYSIDFDLTLSGGKTMTGNYTGTLASY